MNENRDRTDYALRLYFGNLHWDVTVEDLSRFIDHEGFDTSDVYIMKNDETGLSRGFGFVTLELKNGETAGELVKEAIERLDGAKLMGRKLTVAQARPRSMRVDEA